MLLEKVYQDANVNQNDINELDLSQFDKIAHHMHTILHIIKLTSQNSSIFIICNHFNPHFAFMLSQNMAINLMKIQLILNHSIFIIFLQNHAQQRLLSIKIKKLAFRGQIISFLARFFRINLFTMGSSPSSQEQVNYSKPSDHKNRSQAVNIKESLRILKNRPKEPKEQINPEQEGQNLQNEPPKESPKLPVEKRTSRQHEIPMQSNPVNFQALARSNIPKNALNNDQDENEEQNSQETPRNHVVREQHRPAARNKPRQQHSQEDQQEEYGAHQRIKMRHVPKHNEDDYLHNSSIITKPHHNNHKEVDYKQFDSAHIRHKAIKEVHQIQHPTKPIRQHEPTYEHEQLYPKILKNYHHEPQMGIHSGRRHEKEVEDHHEEHKINIFKRHRVGHNQQQHEEEQEEHVPSPHPNFKIHKTDRNLQNSMEVRGQRNEQEEQENNQNQREKGQRKNQPEQYRNRKQSQNTHNVPQYADFRKRKQSNPPQMQKIDSRGKKKIQEIQQKSIADLNKENQFNQTEYEVDPVELVTCRQGCGRKFHSSRIKKHEAICRDVFQKKREEFNAQQHRIVSKQQKKLMKRGREEQKKYEKAKQQEKIPKWKAMSIALRAHVKMGMDENYKPTREEAAMLSQEHHIDVVNCEFCGRNFNKNAAKSHIPFCKGQYQKQIQKERFQKPAKRH